MKERRKIFSAADVAALREGRKTMFREMVVPQPEPIPEDVWKDKRIQSDRQFWWPSKRAGQMVELRDMSAVAPLGAIGDRIWVGETWMDCDIPEAMVGANQVIRGPKSTRVENWIRAAWHKDSPDPGGWPVRRGWKPSITMPRWACRTFTEITAVRVEQVQDITEEDAKKEGITESEIGRLASRTLANYKGIQRAPVVLQFADLWQSIYANWDANPFVWVYSIKLIKP